ncbi:MogA/MoaB family molybdenum cofactor biosynthesis protein [Romboutsia lituseburensis]|uniref:Molybdenum cofactor synthesis domain-containing protein n=1 Tax=Romboutsia lituseburensis DSM 797 TaxID=1121325 RepID=A0A1G9KXS7_9FIRM|nr:MogA/MoaB family molybdenum cofactor biosynthesis protein [Romboutsia lituseburensis]CEH35075.1 Molybdenum cofactor biosynthesis protein MoaB [Romboutsia lituseburensis]SDL54670.1 molybdenum cofactor synthesis domain-containing protein [Romboutsia lituseburensis DSM 797]
MYTVAIITLSDKGYEGQREDLTGPKIKEYIEETNRYNVVSYRLLKDDSQMLQEELIKICDNEIADLILTNGGTGFSKRDITPEATKLIIEKEIPGISEYMRMKSSEITKKAILSRGVSGIRKNSLIINLPGSPKGAIENLSFVMDTLDHGIDILKGQATECATNSQK